MTEPAAPRLAEALAAAATSINAARTVVERVLAVVRAAPGTVPGFDEVSISVTFHDGPVQTRAASSPLVERLDSVQYEAEEGPCFEAFTHPHVVLVPSTRAETRWPTYIERATQAGVTAQMAIPLRNGGEVRGALNLYSTTREGIDPEAPDIAALFATHVGLAMGWARNEEQLNEALATRKTIGQAIGIIMERYQIDDAKAFAFLARVSQTGNIKLRDVAQELVSQTDARHSFKKDQP